MLHSSIYQLRLPNIRIPRQPSGFAFTSSWLCFVLSSLLTGTTTPSVTAGVLFGDPGWSYVFQGDQAYYNDPDGPNPDYVNGDASNSPGGLAGTAALEFPGYVNPQCDPRTTVCEVDNARATWIHAGSQWDGSAPGDPLGGIPIYGQSPPTPPAAPGGVGTFRNGEVTYLRIQDAGQPQSWGWADKGNQADLSSARQEGSNRRIQFAHPIARDAAYGGDAAVIDNGITVSFRTRLATRATGPLDDFYSEDGGEPIPWPDAGKGYPVANNGRGMFMITQTGPDGGGQFAISLLDENTITAEGLTTTRTGLVMNSQTGSPDTDDATATSLNIVDIPNQQLDEWQEVWLTIQKLPEPSAAGTHEVNVYLNGSLDPQQFTVSLGNQNEFGSGPFLGLGLSSGTRWGAYDIDFLAYTEGVIAPLLPSISLAGDYNNDRIVDAADFTVWRDRLGASLSLPNETATPGTVTVEDYEVWKANFGATAPLLNVVAEIPEPESLALIYGGLSLILARCRRSIRRRRQSETVS